MIKLKERENEVSFFTCGTVIKTISTGYIQKTIALNLFF